MLKYFIKTSLLFFVLLLFCQSINAQEIENGYSKDSKTEDTYLIFSKTHPLDMMRVDSKILNGIDSIAKDAIMNKVFPGCQVVVLKNGEAIYDKCFGNLDYESNQNVNPNTLYDIASLSKTSGTLLAIMKLYDIGKLNLNDKASQYLSFLKKTDKENITIKELLFHTSGLPASLNGYQLALEKRTDRQTHVVELKSKTWQFKDDIVSTCASDIFSLQVSDFLYLNSKFKDEAMLKLAQTKLGAKTYVYSCVNFIVLKEIVEKISGIPMNDFLDNEFYGPMGLKYSAYLPVKKYKKELIAPTLKSDFLRLGKIQGYVHDPDAAFLGGVSGNAGLFSTARDIALIHQMILNGGTLNGKQYLSKETCRIFTTSVSPTGLRGLGYNKPMPSKPMSNPCSPSTPMSAYGHTGYTGTGCWVDPDNQIVFVFLSNRTYPNDGLNKLAKMNIRPQIQEIIYKSMKLTKNKSNLLVNK